MFRPSTASAMITAIVSWKRWKLSSTNNGAMATTMPSRTSSARCQAGVAAGAAIAPRSTSDSRPLLALMMASHPAEDDAAEQAGGTHDQHADDDGQRHRQLELGADHIGAGEVLEHADREAAEHRAGRVVDAAHQRAGEGIEQDAEHHGGVEEHDRRHHHAGYRADRRRQTPAQRQHPADPDADEARRARVVGRGAHPETELGEAEE